MISAVDKFPRHFATALGSRMAFVDEGPRAAPPVVFLHGNPTSSYLWRNIIPYVADRFRCIAPDLIGMGDSDKPDLPYRFADHARYLEAFLAEVVPGDQPIHFVLHDWGSALGFDWAASHPARVASLAFMEIVLEPVPTWDQFPDAVRAVFQGMRTPGVGERLVLDDNIFIEKNLPGATVRALTEAELDRYRAPFRERHARRPMLAWPRELPIAGEPADVIARLARAKAALVASRVPKLLFTGEPGGTVRAPMVAWCKSNLPALEVVPIGPGIHYLQEDNPDLIGATLARWLR